MTIAAGRHSHYGASPTSGFVIGELAWYCKVIKTDDSRSEEDEGG
jgi:hypothetical protein